MKIIIRLIGFPLLLLLFIIARLRDTLTFSFRYLRYGGEFITYSQELNPLTIQEIMSKQVLFPQDLKYIEYQDTPEHKATIEYGKYLVVRKDGKKHLETFNGTGWAYNHNVIIGYYLPKIN